MKLFSRTQSVLITSPTNFPSGIAVKTDKAVYWIKDGKRFRLISDRAAKSWAFTTVNATESSLSGMKVAGALGFTAPLPPSNGICGLNGCCTGG